MSRRSANTQPSTPTVLDVARLAGVSPSTVSRVLNGNPRVAADKRESVESSILKLKFRPNLSARSLRSGSTQTVGVLTQHLESVYFTSATLGIEEGLAGSGYTPIVIPAHWNPQQEFDRARLLIARKVDALMILGGNLADAQVIELAQRVPVAITGRRLEAPNVWSFHFDQTLGGQIATQYLIELGHTKIAHIAGPSSNLDARERREGYLRAHRDAHLSVDPRLTIEGDYLERSGFAAINQLLDSGVPFTAVFCANDPTLWGARLALYRRGLEVPRDVSMVGFDDMPQSAFMTPPVSTVRQPTYEMGRAAAQAVLHALGAKGEHSLEYPPLSLVIRETAAAPNDQSKRGKR